MNSSVAIRHDLVLVGGGHTHIQVLRSWAMDPPPGVRVTVVVDRPVAVYSGMVPGFVAGQYRQDELEIDVRPLCMRAGARFIVAAATGLDPSQRRVILEGRPPLAYDTISFDVGSTIAGLDRPGVAEHAIPTRPIGAFVRSADAVVGRARGRPGVKLVVVGAGAGGVELAFAFRARFGREGIRGASVTLLEAGPTVLPGYPAAAVRGIEHNARARGIELRCGVSVARANADHLELEGGKIIPADALVWVTGAASLPLFDGAGLERDPAGFVRVRPTLQVVGHDEIFAVGDCASLLTDPNLPKAGVYAVRQGPTLIANLRARVMGGSMRRYRAQRDFLSLLNLGDGRALASKWGIALEGNWAFTLKDRIDRRFVRRFQVLGPAGDLQPEFARAPAMAQDMICGGCAAKVGESVLTRALVDAEGITLVGGHTTNGNDLSVGFAIFGTAASADALLRIGGLSPGEKLILTKPLGTGVLFFADMRGWARGDWMEAAVASMVRSNASASRVAVQMGASACTDISGFGLAGHLGEMLRASKAGATIDLRALPHLPGAGALLRRGHRSTFHPENARARRAIRVERDADLPLLDLIFDPQTSGGLLFGVAATRAEAALAALHAAGDVHARVIGEVTPPSADGALFEVAPGSRLRRP